ncbi:MAG: AMP-binding protein [Acidimicrobiaceae bacterium]|nr:AMP-binding protein [Acidimicrobiaceae bacterium]
MNQDRYEVVNSIEADYRQAQAARGFRMLGAVPGDRVGLCVSSSIDLLFAIGGALRSGVIPVVLNSQLLAKERNLIIKDAEVVIMIDSEAKFATLSNHGIDEISPYPLTRPMLYTSGTTGRSKGVVSPVLSESDAKKLWSEEIDQWSIDKSDIHLVCSPLYHSAPIRHSLSTLLAGGSIVVPGRFNVETVVNAIRETGPTTTFCTPTHLQRLAEAGKLSALSSLRLVLHAGSKCEEKIKRQAIEAIGVKNLWEFYGSTEGQFTVCSSVDWLERPGTVGRARKNRKLKVDEDEIIWSSCPPYARWEYWRDPARSAAAWHDEFFTVGDLGYLDQDGYLFLRGRRDDLIVSGGVNVYPVEVEAVLQDLDGVSDIVVFARDDEQWGQRVCAAIVGTVTENQLSIFARENLAPFKRPKEYFFVESIPRTALDKLRRSRMSIDLGLD